MKILLTFLLSLLGLISTAQFSYIDLTIGFDQYPQETAWAITQGPDTILSDDDYGYTNYVSTTITERLLMEASPFPFKFTITDEFGDGICCEYGSGFFSAEINVKEYYSRTMTLDQRWLSMSLISLLVIYLQ